LSVRQECRAVGALEDGWQPSVIRHSAAAYAIAPIKLLSPGKIWPFRSRSSTSPSIGYDPGAKLSPRDRKAVHLDLVTLER